MGLFLPELCVASLLPQLQSRRQLGVTWCWWWQSCKETSSSSESLSSEAMAVEGAGPAKAHEQDRLKALDPIIANLERARGGKPDVAFDEVLRQKRLERQELNDQMQSRKSTKALLKAAIAAREKAVIKLEGLQKEEMDLTQLLLLKQQEISDAKSDAAEKAREVENAAGEAFGRGRLRRVGFSCLIFCILFCATVTSAVGAWTRGVAPRGCASQVRGVVQQRRDRGPRRQWILISEVLSQGSPANPVSSTPVAATSTGSAFRAAKAPFPLSACNAICCGVSDQQESGAATGSRSVRECSRPALPDADV